MHRTIDKWLLDWKNRPEHEGIETVPLYAVGRLVRASSRYDQYP
jgi:hypothetical protein